MMKSAIYLGTLVVGLTTLTFTAYASETNAQKSTDPQQTTAEAMKVPPFEQLDVNHDGKISQTEADGSWLAKSFAKLDENKDGFINRNEYKDAVS